MSEKEPNPVSPASEPSDLEPEEKVELSMTQYNALLSKIDELEEPEPKDDLDALADEGQLPQGQQPTQVVNYDNMTNQQLVDTLRQEMDTSVVSPLRVAIETIGVKLEISELTKQEGYKDFWDHQDKIGPIAKANPNLSLKQCYDLSLIHI